MENNNKTKKELDYKKLMLIIIASLALIIIVLLVVLIIKSGSKQPVVNNDATPEPTLSAEPTDIPIFTGVPVTPTPIPSDFPTDYPSDMPTEGITDDPASEEPYLSPSPEETYTPDPSLTSEATDIPTEDPDPVVTFNDSVFEAAFRAMYDREGETIRYSELLAYKDLCLSGCGLTDISDIMKFENLVYVDLGDNPELSDIKPLSVLSKLSTVILYYTDVSDISPLASLSKLQKLDLDGCKVSNLAPLSMLVLLEDLHLGSNSITDITSLARLVRLTSLELQGNGITDVSALSGLTALKRLNLTDNMVVNVYNELSPLIELEVLYLSGNPIAAGEVDLLRYALSGCEIVF